MIVKNIITDEIIGCEELLISPFRPKGLKTIILEVPETNYVVGVGYSEGDYQICISGRRKHDENIFDTIKREMFEELSIIPKNKPKIVLKDNRNYFSIIDLRETTLLNPDILPESGKKDSKDRAIICVHGSKNDIFNYIKNVKINKNNTDYITHVWAESANKLLKYF